MEQADTATETKSEIYSFDNVVTAMKLKKSPEEKLIDTMLNLMLDKLYLTANQILFSPTPEQEKEFWCENCDGFHNTKKCKEKRHD